MSWGDLDNDGDIDLAIAGIEIDDQDNENYVFDIYYRKDGEDLFVKENDHNRDGFINGWLEIVDLDGDADNDIIYSGENQSGNPTNGRILNTFIPQNQGNDWWSQEQWRLINSAVGIYNVGDRTTFITTRFIIKTI